MKKTRPVTGETGPGGIGAERTGQTGPDRTSSNPGLELTLSVTSNHVEAKLGKTG